MENIPDKINFARGPMQWDDTKYAGRYTYYSGIILSMRVKNTHYDFKYIIYIYTIVAVY